MEKYFLTLRDVRDNCEIESWGPLTAAEIDGMFPEVETDDSGVPTEYVTIERA